MKNYLISSLVVVLLICPIVKTYAQPIKAPMFGKDITINNDSNADQRNVKVCVAPNGWLYSCYWNHFENGFTCYIMKSTDNGISWTKLANLDYPNTEKE
ncbi:MAG TPA: sialidase family protein, partial [Bacteroidales bacterium]|nr:sialidase family protein [Bacteroidales bacterium]